MSGVAERTDRERADALEHVGYELWMMAAASVRLDRAQMDGDGVAVNAFLESALLHARALIDFFLQNSARDSDIRRTDFAPEWTPAPADASFRLNDHYRLLHKYLAHLTWERVSKEAPAWTYPNIATDLIAVADAWSTHLASTNRPMWEVFRPQVFQAHTTLTK